MDWKGRRQSDNIEDRRGSSSRGGNPFGRGGMRLPSGGMRPSGLSFKTILIHKHERRGENHRTSTRGERFPRALATSVIICL